MTAGQKIWNQMTDDERLASCRESAADVLDAMNDIEDDEAMPDFICDWAEMVDLLEYIRRLEMKAGLL